MSRRGGLLGRLEDATGVTLRSGAYVQRLEEQVERIETFRDEVEELAYSVFDYVGGRPQEMQIDRRRRLAQLSRVALTRDPLLGAEVNHLLNFSFGRGIPIPQAEDPTAQKEIEAAWTDSVNQEKLTGYEAQRHRAGELKTAANLYPVAFTGAGRVRLAFLDADDVLEVVTHPEDDERPLYYVVRERKVEWDFERDAWKQPVSAGGLPQVVYYAHYRNVADAQKEAQERGEAPPPAPPRDKLREGLVYHCRINRIGRSQFGTPPWARTLRWASAMNQLMTAHVRMAQAASTFIAKRVIDGGEKDVEKAAAAVLNQTGELGVAMLDEGAGRIDPRAARPPASGSFWLENQSDRLESLSMGSGAAQMAQSAQIVRAPLAAESGFNQAYLGDAQNVGSLASATALELPALLTVEAFQETFNQLVRWFTDLVLETALKAGRLGAGASADPRAKALADLRLEEAEDRADAEARLGKKLDYSFSMPYPGRRNLPDVQGFVSAMMLAFDASQENEPLQRLLLEYAFSNAMELEDPRGEADAVIKAARDIKKEHLARAVLGFPDGQPAGQPAQRPGGGNGSVPADQRSQYGENRTATPPGNEMGQALLAFLRERGGRDFEELVERPILTALSGENGGR